MIKRIFAIVFFVVILFACSQEQSPSAGGEQSAPEDIRKEEAGGPAGETSEKETDRTGEEKSRQKEDSPSSGTETDAGAAESATEDAPSDTSDRASGSKSEKPKTGIESTKTFLSLPLWEKEREAMEQLEQASKSESIDKMRRHLTDARNLFDTLTVNLNTIKIGDNEQVEELYTMQKKLIRAYKEKIDIYLDTSETEALKELQKIDRDFLRFIAKAKEVVAENEQ